MIIAFDIETIQNKEALALMPEPEVKAGNTKDKDKLAAKAAEAKAKQVEKAALDPMTARVASYAAGGLINPTHDGEQEYCEIIGTVDDDGERALIQSIFRMLGTEDMRIITWNGIGFDIPMVYKRALILGVDPANFGAPPMPAWTKRYSTDRHYDLMQIWGGWNSQNFTKLDLVAQMVLGERKVEFDVTTIPMLLETEEGRDKLREYNLKDACLTWRLWNRFNGFLFS